MYQKVIIASVILSLLFLSSCTSHRSSTKAKQSFIDPLTTTQPLEVIVPQWLMNIPSGNGNIVGISRVSNDLDSMLIAAKEMAAIQYTRNLSSYNIQKYIQVDRSYAEDSFFDTRSFSFQVSNPAELRKIYENLHLIDYFILHNIYFFGLYEFDESKQPADAYLDIRRELSNGVALSTDYEPEWYKGDDIFFEEDAIASQSKVISSCLIDAWEQATQNARLIQSAYYSTMVQSMTNSEFTDSNEHTKQAVALETLYNLQNIELSKSYIKSYFMENNIRYVVYVELSIHK